jgi:hypothetical protein
LLFRSVLEAIADWVSVRMSLSAGPSLPELGGSEGGLYLGNQSLVIGVAGG